MFTSVYWVASEAELKEFVLYCSDILSTNRSLKIFLQT